MLAPLLRFTDDTPQFAANLIAQAGGGGFTAYTGDLGSASGYSESIPNQEFANVFSSGSSKSNKGKIT